MRNEALRTVLYIIYYVYGFGFAFKYKQQRNFVIIAYLICIYGLLLVEHAMHSVGEMLKNP